METWNSDEVVFTVKIKGENFYPAWSPTQMQGTKQKREATTDGTQCLNFELPRFCPHFSFSALLSYIRIFTMTRLLFISSSLLLCQTLAWMPSLRVARVPLRLGTARFAASKQIATQGETVDFAKYHGLGNDFILLDNRSQSEPSLSPEQSARLCDRNFGVGADGVIFALKPPSEDYDFSMRIYNSDGSEPEMCGNGIRCFAQFLTDLGEEGEWRM
jgi:hypothetical protein